MRIKIVDYLANLVFREQPSAGLLEQEILDIGDVVQPVELAGHKERDGAQQELVLYKRFGIAHEDHGFPLVFDRERIDISECGERHGHDYIRSEMGMQLPVNERNRLSPHRRCAARGRIVAPACPEPRGWVWPE